MISEEKIARERLDDAKKTIEFLGFPEGNLHLLRFPDAEAQNFVNEGISKVKQIIMDADRLLIPSDNNLHKDHQVTYDIAIGAAKQLNLSTIEYWVYFGPQYGRFNKDSGYKQITVDISEELRKKLTEWLQIYQSQKRTKNKWKLYTRYLKSTKKFKYAIFKFSDIGKYHNF